MTVVRDYRAIMATYENEAYRWNAPLDQGFPAIVTYSFYETPELPARRDVAYFVDKVVSFSEVQRDAFRAALDVFAGVTGLVFVETSGEAMIRSYGVTGSRWGGWANYPYSKDHFVEGSDLVLDVTRGDLVSGYRFEIVLHEIGHALGLSHPHEGDYTLADDIDDTLTTIMSYNWASVPNVTLSEMDKTALQTLYGGPVDTAGWEYGFDGDVFRLTAAGANDRVLGVAGPNALSGGAGDDTVFGRYDDDSLYGGPGQDKLFGAAGADHLHGGDDADWIYGGDGKDILYGDLGDDRLFGGAAEDTLHGGDGNDFLVAGPRKSWDADALFGEAGDDILKGNRGNNTLEGGVGGDRLFGRRGADYLDGGDGADELDGGGGRDELHGGDGADILDGGKGKDILFGGAGSDLFVIGASGGRAKDHIADFEMGIDHLSRPLSGARLDDIHLRSSSTGSDTILKIDGDPSYKVLFYDIAKDDLQAILDDGLFF